MATATIADNIDQMAALVSSIKKRHHLSETTALRVIDMTFALAQSNRPDMSPFETDQTDTLPELGDFEDTEGNMLPFPAPDPDPAEE